jgi:Zn-dependent protease with chaperone function
MYAFQGIALLFAGLLAINLAATLGAAALWRLLEPRTRHWPARRRAALIFGLRVVPPCSALLCMAGVVLPAYLIYEPRPPAEDLSPKLAAISVASAACLGLAARRGFGAWRATRRLMAGWMASADPLPAPGFALPACRIRHAFPLVAVVGALRPRLFVSATVLETLTPAEISAVLIHETGHVRARDNFRRGLLRFCRDVLTMLPWGRELDRDWAAAAEYAADEYAAEAGPGIALDLASALVKIARLVPPGATPALPAAALVVGWDVESVGPRVRRLVRLAASRRPRTERARTASRYALATALTCVIASLGLVAGSLVSLEDVHEIVEHIVRALQ